MNPSFIAILAGGRSSRMGADKRVAEWRPGESLLARALALARGALDEVGGGEVLLSVAGVTGEEPPGVRAIADAEAHRGPLGGLSAVLGAVPAGARVGLLPVDMPLLEVGDVAALMRADGPACFEGQELPLALLADGPTRAAVEACLACQRRSVRALLEVLRPSRLPAPPPHRLVNVNTPEALATVRALGGR
jgi:molybdopterin-guanine dinucleotide biosynthesis protein A